MKKQAIVINEKDNVATCVDHFNIGSKIHYFIGGKEETLQLKNNIPLGHKVAIRPIAKGQEVIKYAEVIGTATFDINVGEHVHVHNIESRRGRGDLNS